MHANRIVTLASVTLLVAACNPLSRGPAVRLSEEGAERSQRWQADISSPQSLTGAVQMDGSAWMGPGENEGATEVSIEIENAAPGGVHPWEVHRGRCGSDEGLLGERDSYQALRIEDDGTASATADLSTPLPESGAYYVAIFASATNRDLMVACGNLAPPSG